MNDKNDMAQIQQDSVVVWNPEAVATEVNGEVLLMNFGRNRCYALGTTGSEIWRRLANPVRVSDLVSELRTEYDSPEGELEQDLLQTLNQYAVEGLIVLTR